MPTGKKRTDPRQGTIDSEPEFMKFLESLTTPPQPKEADPEQAIDDGAKADVKVTTTPLVEYLKEKKANKAKEAALAKSAKHARHESHNKSKEDTKKKGKESKNDKADKPSEKEKEKEKVREPVKLLTKKSVAQEVAEAAKTAANQASNKPAEEAPPKSRRANISAAAKILQRDLGLSPGSAHRKARQNAAKADVTVKSDSVNKEAKDSPSKPAAASTTTPTAPSKSTSASATPTPSTPKTQLSEGSRRGRGKGSKQSSSGETAKGKSSEPLTTGKSTPIQTPIILKRGEDSESAAVTSPPATPATASASTPATPTGPKAATGGKGTSAGKSVSAAPKKVSTPSVTAGATRGFVKHANPSQGVTEPLLKRAMEAFGPVTFVEIDKRKGFAYVDFGNHEALVKAIGASPVSVAQGTVQVLERKETKKAAPAAAPSAQPVTEKKVEPQTERSKRGGRGRGRRGGANSGNSEQANSSTPQPEAKGATAAVAG